jgi:hypothetical protein
MILFIYSINPRKASDYQSWPPVVYRHYQTITRLIFTSQVSTLPLIQNPALEVDASGPGGTGEEAGRWSDRKTFYK